jgi:N-acetylmuramoyl-L-alanine amidase
VRPINRIVVHHSASRAGSHSWEDMRRWHLAKGWADIGYHFGIVDDGKGWEVKVGRPVDQVGAHAKGFNTGSIGVCFEGNFEDHRMPWEQFAAGVTLIARLCAKYGVAPERVQGHRELPYATACPGRYFPIHALRGALRDYAAGNWPA